MANTRRKLETRGVIIALLSLVLMNTGCEDKIDSPVVNPSSEKTVEVTLNIGIADDGEETFSADTRSNNMSAGQVQPGEHPAFDVQMSPTIQTRAVSLKPQSLYNLEIRQYNPSTKKCLNTSQTVVSELSVGTAFTANLSVSDECTLIIVAWGKAVTQRLGTGDLSSVYDVSIDQSDIINLDPSNQTDMNKMPHYIHLPKVKITQDGKITSLDGVDVRLLLKRLATRISLEWAYSVTDYTLKQVRLESVPSSYRVIPSPDEDGTYPSLLDQYSTLIIPDNVINPRNDGKGSYSYWIPASVRGECSSATSPIYRTKENAPTGSVYATFIAQNTTAGNENKKLNYRMYLGGNTSTDFNLYPNTDYNYTVNFKHTGLPINDRRVTIIDPIRASEHNVNLVPTANCFMIAPGGAFCFDPYTYQQNGKSVPNATLQGWGTIANVKLLWQTKENGDMGDPVIGVVNSDDDHTNIVELKDNLIYCRVAPNTKGGNGVIAAYDSQKKILWSWHIWVTDYLPDITGNESVYSPVNKRKQKYTYRCVDQLPMMDRNLGANAGYTEVPKTELERSMANGLHYQWGRKDPFPSSYSNLQVTEIEVASDKPTKGMLNLYQPDGISFFKRSYNEQSGLNYSVVYPNPTSFYQEWYSFTNAKWKTNSGDLKNEHDPCPVGWRVASFKNYESFFTRAEYTESTSHDDNVPVNMKNESSVKDDGGALLYYENKGVGSVTYYRFNGYQRFTNKFMYIGLMTNIWCREIKNNDNTRAYALSINYGGYSPNNLKIANNIINNWKQSDAHSVRCIQERE